MALEIRATRCCRGTVVSSAPRGRRILGHRAGAYDLALTKCANDDRHPLSRQTYTSSAYMAAVALRSARQARTGARDLPPRTRHCCPSRGTRQIPPRFWRRIKEVSRARPALRRLRHRTHPHLASLEAMAVGPKPSSRAAAPGRATALLRPRHPLVHAHFAAWSSSLRSRPLDCGFCGLCLKSAMHILLGGSEAFAATRDCPACTSACAPRTAGSFGTGGCTTTVPLSATLSPTRRTSM